MVNDVSDEQRRYLREHEGIAVLTYPAGGRHEGFDAYLQEMHRRTNPAAQLGRAIAGKRILWIDPNDYSSDVDYGMRLLEEAARLAGGRTAILQVPTAADGFAELAERPWDLLITHWGHGQAPAPFQSVGEEVLTEVRRTGLPVPTVVFAGGQSRRREQGGGTPPGRRRLRLPLGQPVPPARRPVRPGVGDGVRPVTSLSIDRAAGVLLGQAAGDALGAGYEFTTPPPDAPIRMKGGGAFGWEPGEWTDDTQMAICVAESAAKGQLDPMQVGRCFLDWFRSGPKDVGNQTRWALSRARGPRTCPSWPRSTAGPTPGAPATAA